MLIHDLRNEGKAQANPILLRREKWVKDLLAQVGWNAGTGIVKRDFDAKAAIVLCRRNLDAQRPAIRLHGLIRVEREVLKDLLA